MKDVTTGTDTRAARRLDPGVASFDLDDEIERLRSEPAWAANGRTAKTLAKAPAFRVVLTVIRRDREVGDDDTWSPLAVQVLRGGVTATRGEQTLEVPAGGLAWFGEGPGWAIRATADSALLLAMSWPEERATEPG